jgi:hypothetical protein
VSRSLTLAPHPSRQLRRDTFSNRADTTGALEKERQLPPANLQLLLRFLLQPPGSLGGLEKVAEGRMRRERQRA